MNEIAIIIPNYNGASHLKECLQSLDEQTVDNFFVIAVDNNSSDNSKDTVKNFSNVIWHKLDKNYGFAKAVNHGIRKALEYWEVRYIILLNNDIVCKSDFIEQISKSFIQPVVYSSACKMINYFDRNIIDDCGDFINKNGLPYARGHGEEDKGQYDNKEFIFGACAGAAMYRREVFEKAGYFDEAFIAYYEDIDFSLRLQLMDMKCYYNPDAICFHKRGGTYGKLNFYDLKMCRRNLTALRIKNYPLFLYFRFIPEFISGGLRRYLFHFRKSQFKEMMILFYGSMLGLTRIPDAIIKRYKIQKSKAVSNSYIENLFK